MSTDMQKNNENNKSLHTGHRQRVISKFLEYGLDSFYEHEVLEMMLFFSIPRADTNDLAHRILEKMGSLENVLEASPDDLMKIPGVGKNTAALLTMFHSVWEYKNTKLYNKRIYLDNSYKICSFCLKYFSEHIEESAIMLLMDYNGRLKYVSTLSKGTVNQTAIYISQILKTALSLNATTVVIAHNHPGGSAQPSSQDKILTKKIYDVLKEVDIHLLDHVVCDNNFFTSFRQCGFFNEMNLQ